MNMLAKTFIIISLSSLLVITGLIDFSEVKAQQQEEHYLRQAMVMAVLDMILLND